MGIYRYISPSPLEPLGTVCTVHRYRNPLDWSTYRNGGSGFDWDEVQGSSGVRVRLRLLDGYIHDWRSAEGY